MVASASASVNGFHAPTTPGAAASAASAGTAAGEANEVVRSGGRPSWWQRVKGGVKGGVGGVRGGMAALNPFNRRYDQQEEEEEKKRRRSL